MKMIISIVVAGVICFIWHYILDTIFGLRRIYDNPFLFFLLAGVPLSFITAGCFYFWDDNSEETAKPETNIDNPKESEVVVTEIQVEKKIIKNGKVIYSEKLKADELKVFENLKDKN